MLVSVRVPFGSMENDVADEGTFEAVGGWVWGTGGDGFGWELDGVVAMLSGLWKAGDTFGGSIGAGEGDAFLLGDGAKLVRLSSKGGRFFTVVTAKGEIASAIAW